MLDMVRAGGVSNLTAIDGDIRALPVGAKTYDVVALLEVLEHIPDVMAAIRAAIRIAKKYIAVTVPSKPDNNPEHIHLLTKGTLTELFDQAGCTRLHFDAVPGHLVMIAALEGMIA
jgi:ubiquinone/menaquinone biosynthesis C-methylase UbiE